MGVGKVGNVVVSGVVEVAERYEAAGRARVAAEKAVNEYLDRPEYTNLRDTLNRADKAWRESGAELNDARIK